MLDILYWIITVGVIIGHIVYCGFRFFENKDDEWGFYAIIGSIIIPFWPMALAAFLVFLPFFGLFMLGNYIAEMKSIK